MSKKQAIIWGAGKIGRGFLGEIFQDAGYHLTFVEYDMRLVEALRQAGRYTIHKTTGKGPEEVVTVDDFDVLHTSDIDAITERIRQRGTVVAISVMQAALPAVAQALVPGVLDKAKNTPDEGLDIILCINMLHPARLAKKVMEETMPAEAQQYLNDRVGLIESVVMRMSPDATPEIKAQDPLAVLNSGYPEMPVDKYGFKGEVPQTKMLRLAENIWAEEVRKIYTLNLAHVCLSYLGTPHGYTYAAKCVMDPQIRPLAEQALAESGVGLAGEFGFTDMEKWNKEIIESLENPALADTLGRLGADSKRKLGGDDRLVGAARLCLKHGGTPTALAQVIAAGYRFDQPNDPGTEAVQAAVREQGIEKALQIISSLDPQEPLYAMILAAWKQA